MIDKAHILSEIRRTAAGNGGNSLGSRRFENETGIKTHVWRGRHWLKWNDAVVEAGLEPKQKTEALNEDEMLERLAIFVIELGKLPTYAELLLKSRVDGNFPVPKTWNKFGTFSERPQRLLHFCLNRPNFKLVEEICRAVALGPGLDVGARDEDREVAAIGYVYLLSFRSDYKIGTSRDPDRRYGEVATQMPDTMTKVHTIKTDDPFGVENTGTSVSTTSA